MKAVEMKAVEIRYIDREHKVTQSVPALGDYISVTIQDRDLI